MNFRIFVVQTPESVLARFMYDGGTELLIDRTRASDIAGLGDDDRVPGFQCCEIGNDRRDSTSNLDHDEAAFFRKRGRERFDLCGDVARHRFDVGRELGQFTTKLDEPNLHLRGHASGLARDRNLGPPDSQLNLPRLVPGHDDALLQKSRRQ